MMNEFSTWKKLLSKELLHFEEVSLNDIKKTIEAKELLVIELKKLKELREKINFDIEEIEIIYFKEMLPFVKSQIIYYHKLNELLLHKEEFNEAQYLKDSLRSVDYFLSKHSVMVNYIKNDLSHDDDYFYLSKNVNIHKLNANCLMDLDSNEHTNGTYLTSKCNAYMLLRRFIIKEIRQLEKQAFAQEQNEVYVSSLKWTASKSALIELIYALKYQGVINDGEVEIKTLTKEMERLFNIDLGDIYRTFNDIKQRKKDPAQFIESLKEAFIKNLDR